MARTPAPAPVRRAAAAPARSAAPARAAAAPARRAAAAPVDDEFADFEDFDEPAPAPKARGKAKPAPVEDDEFADFEGDGDVDGEGEIPADDEFADFDEPAPTPKARGKAKPAPVEDDEFADFDGEGEDGEASDDPDADDFEPEADAEEAVEEEVVELSPKLRNGDYVLPKGAKAWWVDGDDDGWKRAGVVEDLAARKVKVTYNKKLHNYAVAKCEDKPGKTFVVLTFKSGYIVTTAEQLIDLKTNKPAKILAAAPVEEAPAPKARGTRAAAPVEEVDEAPELSKAQTIAVRKFDAAVAELKAAFGIG